MRLKLKYLTLLALPLLAACSSTDEPVAEADGPVELKLALSLTGQDESRAYGYDMSLAPGTCIALLVTEAGTTTEVDCRYAVVGTDGTISGWGDISGTSVVDERAIYFPVNGTSVDIYAVAGPLDKIAAWQWNDGGGIEADVQADQTNAANFAASDLLYCEVKDQKPTTSPVALTMKHQLSKIEIALTVDKGVVSRLQLCGLTTGALWMWDNSSGMLIVEDEPNDMWLTTSVLPDVNEVVVVPQTVEAGNLSIVLVLANEDVLTWVSESDVTFEPGKKYRYNVTVNINTINVVPATVTDWLGQGEVSGDATFNQPVLEAVDLGLSVLWANINFGAAAISDPGWYIHWGATATYPETTNSLDDASVSSLPITNDVARQYWGGTWRYPTTAEFQELVNNVTRTEETIDGMNGVRLTSTVAGYEDKSIFMPYGGWIYNGDFRSLGSMGYYWTSNIYLPWYTMYSQSFELTSTWCKNNTITYRSYFRSLRPVCSK